MDQTPCSSRRSRKLSVPFKLYGPLLHGFYCRNVLSFPCLLGFWHFLTCLECRTSHLLFLFSIEGADTHRVVNSVCLWREGEVKMAYSTLLLISLQCFQIVCVGLVCFSIFSFKEKQLLIFIFIITIIAM